jgi:hypothetical protein
MAELRTAPAGMLPCELYAHHATPRPSRTQGHHRFPEYLQRRVHDGKAPEQDLLWLCGLCHDSVHDVIAWLLGEGRRPDPMPPRRTQAEARTAVERYRAAGGVP